MSENWSVLRDGGLQATFWLLRADGSMFAKLYPAPDAERNASMAAAAPKLYAALEAMVIRFAQPFGDDPSDNLFPEARAALATARGEVP